MHQSKIRTDLFRNLEVSLLRVEPLIGDPLGGQVRVERRVRTNNLKMVVITPTRQLSGLQHSTQGSTESSIVAASDLLNLFLLN